MAEARGTFEWVCLVLAPIYVIGGGFSLSEAVTNSNYARYTATFGVFEFENAAFQWVACLGFGAVPWTLALIMTFVFAGFGAISVAYYRDVQTRWDGEEGAQLAES